MVKRQIFRILVPYVVFSTVGAAFAGAPPQSGSAKVSPCTQDEASEFWRPSPTTHTIEYRLGTTGRPTTVGLINKIEKIDGDTIVSRETYFIAGSLKSASRPQNPVQNSKYGFIPLSYGSANSDVYRAYRYEHLPNWKALLNRNQFRTKEFEFSRLGGVPRSLEGMASVDFKGCASIDVGHKFYPTYVFTLSLTDRSRNPKVQPITDTAEVTTGTYYISPYFGTWLRYDGEGGSVYAVQIR